MHLSTTTPQTGMRIVRLWLEWKKSAAIPHTGAQPAVSTDQAFKISGNQLITEITSGASSATSTSWHFLVIAGVFQWSMRIFVGMRLQVAPQHNFGRFITLTYYTLTAVTLTVASNPTLELFQVKITLVTMELSTSDSGAQRGMRQRPSGGSVDTCRIS